MSYELMLPDAVSPETAAVGQAAAGTGEGNDDTVAIRLAGIGKAYPGCARPADRLLQIFLGERHRRYQQFWALHPIDLDVRKGEVLGIVGHNGAGKSTLLQIIAGTMLPSHGSRRVQGRLSALLELGAGFNPEFTGRENVFLAAALLGNYFSMTLFFGVEMLFGSVAALLAVARLGTYSSGMQVRLAFALATASRPAILIVDEALSVGDGAFARRSFDRIMQFKDQGRTILFCSHSLYQIESLCTQALWLDRGRLQQLGPPADVAAAYQAHLDRLTAGTSSMPASAVVTPLKAAVKPEGHARIKGLALLRNGRRDTEEPVLSDAGSIEIVIDFESDPALETPTAAVTINTTDGRIIASTGTWIDGCPLSRDAAGRGQARVSFTDLPLLKGDYAVSAYLFCERGLYIYSAAEHFDTFSVVQRSLEQGLVSLPHRWSGTPGPADTEEVAMPDEGPRLRVRTGGCIDELSPGRFRLFWQTHDRDGEISRAEAPIEIKLKPTPWWICLLPWLIAMAIALALAFVIYGFIRPARFPRQLGVQIADEEDVDQGFFIWIRKQRGTGIGFYHFTNMHHLYPDVRFAFGFPHERALRVGLRVGVYAEVDAILALTWSSLPPRRNWRVRTREIGLARGDSETKLIDGLWQAMQHDWWSARGAARSVWREDAAGASAKMSCAARCASASTCRLASLAAVASSRCAYRCSPVTLAPGSSSSSVTPSPKPALNRMLERCMRVTRASTAAAGSSGRSWCTIRTNSPRRTAKELVTTMVSLAGSLWLMAGDTDFR